MYYENEIKLTLFQCFTMECHDSFWFDSVKGRRAIWNQMSTLAKNSISKLHDQYGDTAN